MTVRYNKLNQGRVQEYGVPEYVENPSISSDETPAVGETLGLDFGTVAGGAGKIFRAELLRGAAVVVGNAAESYIPVPGDIGEYLFLRSFAKGPGGEVSALSTPVGPISGAADYIVTNDAEWNAVMTNPDATLAGKIIEIAAAPSSFGQLGITNKDIHAAGGRVTVRSQNGQCGVPSIIMNGTVRGFDFSNLVFQNRGWPKAFGAAVVFNNGTFGKLRFLNGTKFRHGYGPTSTDINTAIELPEYDRVNNVQTAATTSQTFPLTWKDPAMTEGWIEFFNRGTNSVRVAVGGSGVVATSSSTLVAAGGYARISSLSPLTATHFAVMATAGTSEVNARTEIGLAAYLGVPFSSSGAAVLEDIEIRGCVFRDLASGIKGLNPATAIVMDNDFDRIYQDIISMSPKQNGWMYILRNLECLPFCRSGIAENLTGDARDPHGDTFQMFGGGGFTIGPVYYAGNRIRVGAKRNGVGSQGVFVSDNDLSPSYSKLFFISTMQVGGAPRALNIGENNYPVRDSMIYGATIVDWRDAANTFPTLTVVTDDGSVYVGSTIVSSKAYTGTGVPSEQGLVLMGGLTASQRTAMFPSLGNFPAAQTRAEIEAAITPVGAGLGLGATATRDAIDWNTLEHTAVIRWENVPSGVHWNGLTEQTPSAVITLPLRKVLNRRPDQTVLVGAGTEWRKVATDGVTELLAWTAEPGVVQPDESVQIRRTTGLGGETVTASVTINGFEQSVSIRSANIPSMFLVRPATVAYFKSPATVPAGTTRMTMRMKVRVSSITNNMQIFTQESNGFDLNVLSTGAMNITVEDGTGARNLSAAQIAPAGTFKVNTWQEIILDVNHATQMARMTLNGQIYEVPFALAGNGVFQSTRGVSFLANTAGLNPLPASTQAADMSVDYNGVLHKAIPNDAAAANADAWKQGAGVFTNN